MRKILTLAALASIMFCSCGGNGKGGTTPDKPSSDGDFDTVVVTAEFDTEVTIPNIGGGSETYTTNFDALNVDYFYGFKEDGSDAKFVKVTQHKNSVDITVPVGSSGATLYAGIRYTLKEGADKTNKVGLGRYVAATSFKCYKGGVLVSNPKGSVNLMNIGAAGSNYDLMDETSAGKFKSFSENSKKPRSICTISK